MVSTPSRYGVTQQQLIVYPPGITSTDRRWLRAWRGFPIWGGLLWIVLQVVVSYAMAPWPAIGVTSAVCGGAGAAVFAMAAGNRRQVRTLNACVSTPNAPELVSGQRRLRILAKTLLTAHAHYGRGELSAVDYEQIWWYVYDAMAPQSASTRDGSGESLRE